MTGFATLSTGFAEVVPGSNLVYTIALGDTLSESEEDYDSSSGFFYVWPDGDVCEMKLILSLL